MIILCADDYALTEGVSRAIGELAAARRLSATSVLVTSAHWPSVAPRLLVHRPHMSLGLHLDLTLGPPTGPMPRLARRGAFPSLPVVVAMAVLHLLERGELEAEISRQLDRFEAGLGHPPDHIDGHQHVHAIPVVRRALLDVVSRRYPSRPPLLRDPVDRPEAIKARGTAIQKAMLVRTLARGFGALAQQKGLPINDGFSGFSEFRLEQPYADELRRAFVAPGRRHIVMCHPGHVDAELASRDPVVDRRKMEYEALLRESDLPQRIWRPSRSPDGSPLDWTAIQAEAAA